MAKAQQDWDDYKEAFFATGGTEEQWGDREMDVIIDYEIKSQTDTTVSFVVDFGEGWIAANQQRYCYNLDLENDRDITLEDILGENWVEICNEAVKEGMAAQVEADGFDYFFRPNRALSLPWMRAPASISMRTVIPFWYSRSTPSPPAQPESWSSL